MHGLRGLVSAWDFRNTTGTGGRINYSWGVGEEEVQDRCWRGVASLELGLLKPWFAMRLGMVWRWGDSEPSSDNNHPETDSQVYVVAG